MNSPSHPMAGDHASRETLAAENARLKNFIEIERRIGTERQLEALLPLVMQEISHFLDADRSTLFLLNWEKNELWTKFAQGLQGDRIRIELKIGLVGSSVLTRRVVNVTNAYEDPRFNPDIDKITGLRTESLLAAPIENRQGDVIGAIEMLNKETGIFSHADEKEIDQAAQTLAASRHDLASAAAKQVLKSLIRALKCDRGSIFAIDPRQAVLQSVHCEGLEDIDIQLDLKLGIAGLVAISGKALNIRDAYADSRFDRRTDQKTGYRTRCLLCVPVKNKAGRILGVVQVINKKGGVFHQQDLAYLEMLSSSVAVSIENALLLDEQQKQFRRFLEVMAASIDAKDKLTAGHSERVRQLAAGIARELGFGEDDIDLLNVAALLHDYGKLGIDDQVLKKPGKLTSDEYQVIKQHVLITESILSKMYFARHYKTVPLIASCHHERLDGSGYLKGMQAKDIPFMSKILSVADVFEALTSKRHYHEAISPEAAIAQLEADADTKYDIHVIEALKQFIETEADH